jgi:hypothetical protein
VMAGALASVKVYMREQNMLWRLVTHAPPTVRGRRWFLPCFKLPFRAAVTVPEEEPGRA